MRKPDFKNLLDVLQLKTPDRPTLFEFFLNPGLYAHLAGCSEMEFHYPYLNPDNVARSFAAAGYDYATIHGSQFQFPVGEKEAKQTHSLNSGAILTDRKSFDAYKWPCPDDFDYSHMAACNVPEGMKLMVAGPNGLLENAIALCGYENLCIMTYEDSQLVYDIFEQIGSRLLRYYELSIKNKSVGLLMSNDD